jgi:cytochrome c oxidase cbb3-type subunit 4
MDIDAFLKEAHLWSLLVVGITFILILTYALWPSLQSRFDEAAKFPLRED